MFLSMQMKLGAFGDGKLMCDSSWPLLVLTNSRSPKLVTLQEPYRIFYFTATHGMFRFVSQ